MRLPPRIAVSKNRNRIYRQRAIAANSGESRRADPT
jgi:hypothetical protein